MTHASAIGSRLVPKPDIYETSVGDRPAIIPAIRGTPWITGISQLMVDPAGGACWCLTQSSAHIGVATAKASASPAAAMCTPHSS